MHASTNAYSFAYRWIFCFLFLILLINKLYGLIDSSFPINRLSHSHQLIKSPLCHIYAIIPQKRVDLLRVFAFIEAVVIRIR